MHQSIRALRPSFAIMLAFSGATTVLMAQPNTFSATVDIMSFPGYQGDDGACYANLGSGWTTASLSIPVGTIDAPSQNWTLFFTMDDGTVLNFTAEAGTHFDGRRFWRLGAISAISTDIFDSQFDFDPEKHGAKGTQAIVSYFAGKDGCLPRLEVRISNVSI